MTPYLTPFQIFRIYQKENPEKCKGKSTTEICKLAGLSDEQIKELKKTNYTLFNFHDKNISTDQDFNTTEIFGGNFSDKKVARTKSCANKPSETTKHTNIKCHPIYKDLILDSQGNIDKQQFSLGYLKTKYNETEYNFDIKEENNEKIITVKNKKTSKIVCTLKTNHDGSEGIYINYIDGNKNSYKFSYSSVYEAERITKDKHSIKHIYVDKNKISDIITSDANNYYTLKHFDINGKIGSLKTYQLQNGQKINYKSIDYHNGYPYKQNAYTEYEENILVQDLYRNLTNRNNYGYVVIDKAVIDNITNRIDKNNIDEVLNEFSNKYGKSILHYLKCGYGLDDKTRETLISHIDKCYEAAHDYNPKLKIIDSRVNNPYYTSKHTYDVTFDNDLITIADKTTGKQAQINLKKLLEKFDSPQEKFEIKKTLQKLSGEVLMLIAKEGVTFASIPDNEKNTTKRQNIVANYHRESNVINLCIESINTSTIIHELGHAIDYSNILGEPFATKGGYFSKFNKYYNIGIKRYLNDGYIKTSSHENSKKNSLYFATCEEELFAEILTLLYMGEDTTECGRQKIPKYFRECIDIERDIIDKYLDS